MTNLILQDTNKLGIVLTPPYVAKLMAGFINVVNRDNILDLCAGTGNLLSACKEIIPKSKVLGIEQFAQLQELAPDNIKHKIIVSDCFTVNPEVLNTFKPNALILNPPYQTQNKGMEFVEYGLKYLGYGDIAVIITQDSAGSGRAAAINKKILTEHRLICSVKMPTDLFLPAASVQTSIYILEAHTPHDFAKDVKFIDFSNDGYKRTNRRGNNLSEVDRPLERYSDLLLLFQYGFSATQHPNFHNGLWTIEDIYIQDKITDSGADWNFNQHKVIDSTPTLDDFKKSVFDFMKFEWKQGKPFVIPLNEKHIKDGYVALDLSKLL